MKRFVCFVFFLLLLIFAPQAFAQGNSYVSIVNPVRGDDFWDLKDQKPETAVLGQIAILEKFNLPATWLIRFDALDNQNITLKLKERSLDEKGLFLEITPSWTTQAKVGYKTSNTWHAAGSAFLTGYEREERIELIDTAFKSFKDNFGIYPVSVGAWWIDSFSLDYMQKKYGISSALIVADQYSTDNYQIWGQYFGTPYYPSKNNALHPAQTLENKLDIVMTQWALRDPVNAYGNGVMESTFSIQANDYMDYHDLDTGYFSTLIATYTKQQFNKFAHIVVGLENSYEWNKYSGEYQRQIETLARGKEANVAIVTLKDFASWYKTSFPQLSPEQLIIADDPLGSSKKTVWYMNPYYRVGWFYNQNGSVFRDIRQYIDGEEELCFRSRCDSVNFATSATRVLDDVSFGHKWVIDEGRINNFKVEKKDESFFISYVNEAGNLRQIGLLPRDISIDEKIFSIDGAILNATKKENSTEKGTISTGNLFKWSPLSISFKIGSFLVFLIFVVIIPGLILSNNSFNKNMAPFLRLFISGVIGLVVFTLFFYVASLYKFKPLIFLYILISFIIFLRFKYYNLLSDLLKDVRSFNLISTLVLAGTIFQVTPTFRSGLNFTYGLGFWGPNTHDGVWHMALINQLIKSVPPENPIFSGSVLKNYHFFYDLLIAATAFLSKIPVADLVFRLYPVVFSLMLGIGSYYLVMRLFEERMGVKKSKLASLISLYLIYFAGSFGWIVEFLRERHFGGESAFWANQAISFNLNPPFAISLVIMIAVLHILMSSPDLKGKIIAILIFGTLASFKSYTGVLVLGSLLVVSIIKVFHKKDFSYFWIAICSITISMWLFFSNFAANSAFLIFAPFWFIHSMVDSPDRVGWVRLSLARTSSFALGLWPKFILAEITSFMLFIIGNLGMRFLSFGIFFKFKDIVKNDTFTFIFIISIASMGIPILFIQSGNPWNTIQFFYPVLYTSALFAGVVLSFIIFKLNRIFATILVGIILILAPINSFVTARGYFGKTPHAFISAKELEGLQFLSAQPDGIVLTYPYDGKLKQNLDEPWPLFVYDSTAYVSALSEKPVYLEDEPQNQILLTDYKKRLVASKDFFLKPLSGSSKFLQQTQIKYIYLPKIYNIRLDESTGIVTKTFENEELVTYATNY
ncbi:hypothetical protein HYU45_02365 [Candidatus Daviesbacteria bacterium]|nr:hypothetical protein [Candidatus Daviesbacteria bacterium]